MLGAGTGTTIVIVADANDKPSTTNRAFNAEVRGITTSTVPSLGNA